MARVRGQLSIGGVAKLAGVNVETVRFYQRKALLPEPRRPDGGTRTYDDAFVDRLRFIRGAQKMGFSLDDIGQLLALQDGTRCKEARQLAEGKLREIRERLEGLQRMESVLTVLVDACHTAKGKISCPLITALTTQADDVRDVLSKA